MATARTALKQYFLTGKKPTQAQFANLIDSFFHLDENSFGIANITGLSGALASKASAAQVVNILNALGALENLETTDKTSFVAAINELKELIGTGGGSGEADVFESDFVVSLSGGKTFLKWTNGQTVPAAGKSAKQILEIGAKEAIAPSASLSRSPASIVINKKADIDITINYSHAINSLGATLSEAILERSRDNATWTELFNLSVLPNGSYLDEDINAGAIDNRPVYYRFRVQDSEGLTATATTQVSFAYRSFLGYRSTAPATIAEIVDLGNSGINDGKARTFTGVTAGVGDFTYYAYKAGAGDLTGLIMDGSSPIFGAITKVGDVAGLDEFGGSVTYRIYKSNASNAFSNNTLAFL